MNDFLIGTGIKFDAMEVVELDTRQNGGKVASYPFSAAAYQTSFKVLSVRPIWFEECRIPGTATAVELQGMTLSTRTPDGEFVMTRIPLLTLSEQPAGLTYQRPKVWAPRFIDWRRSFVSLLVPFAGLVRLQILYVKP